MAAVMKFHIAVFVFGLLSVLSTVGQEPNHRSSEQQIGKRAPFSSWLAEHQRKRLAPRFLSTATLARPLQDADGWRFRLVGDTAALDVRMELDAMVAVRVTGLGEEVVAEGSWTRMPAPGDRVTVGCQANRLVVSHNHLQVMTAPLPRERWRSFTWARNGGEQVATYRFQKLGDVFFRDDFMHNEKQLDNWQSATGQWAIHALRNPTRSANAFSLHCAQAPGKLLTGHWFWQDYAVECAVFAAPDERFGLLAHHANAEQSYRLEYVPERQRLQVSRLHEGQAQVLAEAAMVISPRQWCKLRLEVLDGRIGAWVDDRLVLHVVDPRPITGGTAGLFADGTGTQFDDVDIASAHTVYHDFSSTLSPSPLRVWPALEPGEPLRSGSVSWQSALRQNVYVKAVLSIDSGGAAELRVRDSGEHYVACQVDVKDQVAVLRMLEVEDDVERYHDRCEVPLTAATATLSLHAQDRSCWVEWNGKRVLHAQTRLQQPGNAITVVDGLAIQTFAAGPQKQPPMVNNRIRTFAHERSMASWSRPTSDWLRVADAPHALHLHRTDFWQDVSVAVAPGEVADGDVQFGLSLTPQDMPEFEQMLRLSCDVKQGAISLQLHHGERLLHSERQASVPDTIRLSKAAGRAAVWSNGRVLWDVELPSDLHGLCRVGRWGPGGDEKWAAAVRVHAHGVKAYSFKHAPVDWSPVAGEWEVTNRWQCDPRWSFFSGHNRDAVACNWNKHPHGANVSVDFFVGPKMQKERGNKYSYAGDMNAVICADGTNINSGYSFVFGSWQYRGATIFRRDAILANNQSVHLKRSQKMHRRWIHIKIRKQGASLSYWVDGKLAAQAMDPAVLQGNRFGLWTWDNGIMIAQVHVSDSGDLPAVTAADTVVPLTPYDGPQNAINELFLRP